MFQKPTTMNYITTTDSMNKNSLLNTPLRVGPMSDQSFNITNIPESEVLYHAEWKIFIGVTSSTKLDYYWTNKGLYDKRQKALIPVSHETNIYYIRQVW